MKDKTWDEKFRRKQRRMEISITKLEDAIEWFRKEVMSRAFGNIEFGVTLHEGEIKRISRTVSEHLEEEPEDESHQ